MTKIEENSISINQNSYTSLNSYPFRINKVYTDLIIPLWLKQFGEDEFIKNKRIIEIFCGEANLLRKLIKYKPEQLIGIDNNNNNILSEEDKEITIYKSSVLDHRIWEKLKEIDIIYTLFGHLFLGSEEEILELLMFVNKSLAIGGKVFLISENFKNYSDELKDIISENFEPKNTEFIEGNPIKIYLENEFEINFHIWNDFTLKKLMKQAGFKDVSIDYSYDRKYCRQSFSEIELTVLNNEKPFFAISGYK